MIHFIFGLLLSFNVFSGNDIVGGINVPEGHPVMQSTVALLAERQGELVVFCSGVVIHEYVVLTAAHCVDELMTSVLYVANGDNPLSNKDKFKVKLLKFFKHQFWSTMESVEDIALLITEKPMGNYQIAEIGNPKNLSISNRFIQAGYGHQSFDSVNRTYPHFGKLQMLMSGKFSQLHNHVLQIDNNGQTGVMGGDSGGALYSQGNSKNLTLHGILSQGGPTGDGHHAVYASPYFFMDWMKCSLPKEIKINHPLLANQFPCDNNPLVKIENLVSHNQSACQSFREGWSISKEEPYCWPTTKKSCEVFSIETQGEVFWDENVKKCLIVER